MSEVVQRQDFHGHRGKHFPSRSLELWMSREPENADARVVQLEPGRLMFAQADRRTEEVIRKAPVRHHRDAGGRGELRRQSLQHAVGASTHRLISVIPVVPASSIGPVECDRSPRDLRELRMRALHVEAMRVDLLQVLPTVDRSTGFTSNRRRRLQRPLHRARKNDNRFESRQRAPHGIGLLEAEDRQRRVHDVDGCRSLAWGLTLRVPNDDKRSATEITDPSAAASQIDAGSAKSVCHDRRASADPSLEASGNRGVR